MKIISTSGGICTGRNGTRDISGITVSSFGEGSNKLIRIDCLSKKRGVMLNAGVSFDVACAKEIAKQIKSLCKA